MIYDLQRASVLKRISAFLFDIIMISIVAVGVAILLSLALGYDAHQQNFNTIREQYETLYGVDFDISKEEYDAFTEAEKAQYIEKVNEANKALNKDQNARTAYQIIINLSLGIITGALLISFAILEFAVPLIFKNGQTLGKKIFGIALMRTDGVRITGPMLFARAILGKFAVETMVAVYFLLMFYFGMGSLLGIILIAVIPLANLVLVFATKNHYQIHDLLASTVAVDMTSQMIFESPEALLEYKKMIQREAAEKADY